MPIYDVLCPNCEKEWEDYATIQDKDMIPCPFCHEEGKINYGITQITVKAKPKVHGNQMGEIDPGLGEYVGSEDDRKRIMKENHLEEVGGERCSTTHLRDVENKKQREEIDGELKYNGFANVSVKSADYRGF